VKATVEINDFTIAADVETCPFLEFENVSVRLGGRKVLSDIQWRVDQGQNWAVWGPNGAGKSTLGKTLLGQAAVVGGFIRRDYNQNPRFLDGRPAVALVSSDQYHRFHEQERMLEEMRGFSGQGRETRVSDLPADYDAGHEDRRKRIEILLGLTPIFSKPLLSLSSGEMRKLLLGRALLAYPHMLVLDEPFNGLDAETRTTLKPALEKMCTGDMRMVFITHRLTEIPAGVGHVLHLEQGRVVWQGRREAFLRHLSHQEVQVPEAAIASIAQSAPAVSGAQDTPLVRMRDVTVRHGRSLILEGVDWCVNAGEHWALIGPNGAGKTTLLKLITGEQLQAYANEVELFGRRKGSGEALAEIRDRIGYMDDVLQARYQHDMSGLDVVCSGFFDSVGLYRRCTMDQIRTARQWLCRLALDDLSALRFARLSFGQQRMLLIARAMVKSPRLLILDEPCNGLDGRHRQKMLSLLNLIGAGGHTCLIYTSHRADELPDCITHLLSLENGRVIRSGPKS
jgi:molybdate transport system ATP-binding protein